MDSLGFLISDVSRLMRKRFDDRAREIGVTRPQWRTLSVLRRHEGANQGKLADLLEVEPISLCRMIDRLEESGMVERRRDPGDRRAWQIFLTDKARPLLDQLRVMAESVFGQALEGISPDDAELLFALLQQMRCNLLPSEEEIEAVNG